MIAAETGPSNDSRRRVNHSSEPIEKGLKRGRRAIVEGVVPKPNGDPSIRCDGGGLLSDPEQGELRIGRDPLGRIIIPILEVVVYRTGIDTVLG